MCDAKNGGAPCKSTADGFSGMTAMFGSSFHMNGMREACDCVPADKAPARHAEYVTYIYDTYNKKGVEAVPHAGDCKDRKGKDDECSAAERVTALLAKNEGKEGKLFWELVNTYKHIAFVQEGSEALSDDQCEVADRKGVRFGGK